MNAVMMPQTVPNSPINGAAEPVVARNVVPVFELGQLDVGLALHRASDVFDSAKIGREFRLRAPTAWRFARVSRSNSW